MVIITMSYQSTFYWHADDFSISYIMNIEEECPIESEDTSNKIEKQHKILTTSTFEPRLSNYISYILPNPQFLELCLNGNHPYSIEIPPEV